MATSVLEQTQSLQYNPFSGRVSVHLFGKPLDWNISGDDQADVHRRLGDICAEVGVAEVLAPHPSKFNAEICEAGDLQEKIPVSPTMFFYRGFDADGVILEPRTGFWLSSADCITIIAHDPRGGCTVAAHGGRDCLIDRDRVNGEANREHESVVHAIMERFAKRQRKYVKVFMTCGIGPENFFHKCDHEQYGAANTRMVLDLLAKWGATCLHGDHFLGKICLSEIIRAQFVSLGVAPHNIGYDGVETYGDLNRDGSHRWWSYRRGDGKKRNGVLVVRRW